MSKPLLELMAAVDASPVAAEDDGANLVSRRRASYGRSRQTVPVVAPQTPPASSTETDASFEFGAVISNSSASPASMVFSDGQLRAHQFPAVRSPAGCSQVASPVLGTSVGGTTGSKKRVSFAADGAGKKTSGAQKKGGGMLGCIGSACGLSRDEVVEPTINANRKVVCV